MANFKLSVSKGGIQPIVIDYNNYKITILMQDGVTIKFFKEHEDRWYKLKECSYSYFQIDECIAWAKGCIDNDETHWFQDKLLKEVARKN